MPDLMGYARYALVVALVAGMAGCGEPAAEDFPAFDEPELMLGRAVWLEHCQACHGTGLAGAPRIGDRAAWQARIGQGMPILFEHALNGFAGSTGTEMPARGGNAGLEDATVKAAVRYMIRASE